VQDPPSTDIPEWLNFFVFQDSSSSANLLLYMKYKRGLLTPEEIEALKATLCPDSDKEKAGKTQFRREYKLPIKDFKNMGFIFILDSSMLCAKSEAEKKKLGLKDGLSF
jgi:hypothetical protein